MILAQKLLMAGGGKRVEFLGAHSDYVDRSVYTFTGIPIGSGGLVVVCVGLDANGSGGFPGPTMTVGGVSATRDTVGTSAGNTNKTRSDIFSVVASGPTANIVVTPARASNGCVISVYAIYGLESNVVNNTATDNGDTGSANILTLNVNTVSDSIIIGCTASVSSAGTVWAGLNEDADIISVTDNPSVSSASFKTELTETPRNITATDSNPSVGRYDGSVAVYK